VCTPFIDQIEGDASIGAAAVGEKAISGQLMLKSDKIKHVAIAIIELCLSESIS